MSTLKRLRDHLDRLIGRGEDLIERALDIGFNY